MQQRLELVTAEAEPGSSAFSLLSGNYWVALLLRIGPLIFAPFLLIQLLVDVFKVLTQTTVDPLTTQVLFLDANVIDTGGQGRRTRRLARSSGQVNAANDVQNASSFLPFCILQETSTAGKRRSVITQNEIAYGKMTSLLGFFTQSNKCVYR